MAMNDKNQYRPRRWRLKKPPSRSLQTVEETFRRKVAIHGYGVWFSVILKGFCWTNLKDNEGRSAFLKKVPPFSINQGGVIKAFASSLGPCVEDGGTPRSKSTA